MNLLISDPNWNGLSNGRGPDVVRPGAGRSLTCVSWSDGRLGDSADDMGHSPQSRFPDSRRSECAERLPADDFVMSVATPGFSEGLFVRGIGANSSWPRRRRFKRPGNGPYLSLSRCFFSRVSVSTSEGQQGMCHAVSYWKSAEIPHSGTARKFHGKATLRISSREPVLEDS